MGRLSKKKEFPSIESKLSRLDQITELLNAGESSLDRASELYEEGIELVKESRDQLKSARAKIQKLNRLTGELEPFKDAGDESP